MHNNRVSHFTHNNRVSQFTDKNNMRKYTICMAFLLFSIFIISQNSIKVLAVSTLSISQAVENNKVTFKITDGTNLSDAVSILVMTKDTNSIIYMDQGKLNNGEYTFSTVLPKGEYTGYVGSSNTSNFPIQDLTVENDEKIIGFKTISPISVELNSEVVLPSTVIAIFDDGANRILAVNWDSEPDTTKNSKQKILGSVDGYDLKASIEVIVGNIVFSSDATLSEITVNGKVIENFVAETIVYDVELPAGTTAIPQVAGIVTATGKANAVVTDATVLPGAATIVVTAEDGTTEKTYTINFTVAPTVLQSITAPAPITGIANGTEKTAQALGLPNIIELVTNAGKDSANVTWDVVNSSYDASSKAPQTVVVTGIVTLPAGIENVNSVSLDLTIQVTVAAGNLTVTFDSQGGSEVVSKEVEYNSLVTVPTTPIKTGYGFGGWYKDAECSVSWNFAEDKVTADTTLYTKWIANVYKVTFDSKGGTAVQSQSVEYDGLVIEPAEPMIIRSAFAGWYKDAEYISTWDFDADKVTDDITLYAKWIANSYTVAFNSQGGSEVEKQIVAIGDTTTEPISPTKTGYIFAGWYEEPTCKTQWKFKTDKVKENITLYAKWSVNSYTVTFDSRGGSEVANVTAQYNNTITAPTDPTKVGYIFKGWYKDPAYKKVWDFARDTVTEDTKLYAKWEKTSLK